MSLFSLGESICWIWMLFCLPPSKYFSSLVNWEIELKHRCRFLQTQWNTLYYLKTFFGETIDIEHYLGTLFNIESSIFGYFLIWGIWHWKGINFKIKSFICAALLIQILKICMALCQGRVPELPSSIPPTQQLACACRDLIHPYTDISLICRTS